MRAILFTSEEPLFLPRYLQPILKVHAAAIERVVIVPFDAPITQQLREQARMYGCRAGSRIALRYVRGHVLDALPARLGRRITGRHHSVAAVARTQGIPVERISDVNDTEFVKRIRTLDPDLILSIVAGQRLSSDLLASATDAINLHGSLLPHYRGRATAFWPLYYGDDRSGVTAHRMTERFDAGPIIARRAFPIEPGDTVHSVYRKLASTGADLAIDLLDSYPDLPSERPNETSEDDYHGLPGPEERRVFFERGNNFL